MEASPSNKLPGELLNEIWRLTFVETSNVDITSTQPASLGTCRAVRAEFASIYYAESDFHLQVIGGAEVRTLPAKWLQVIGLECSSEIKPFTISR